MTIRKMMMMIWHQKKEETKIYWMEGGRRGENWRRRPIPKLEGEER
jgi:hypothetical protein